MRTFLLLVLIFLVNPAHASDSSFIAGFIDWVSSIAADVGIFFSEGLPSLIERGMAYAIEWALYLKLQLFLQSVQIAYAIAEQIASDLNLTGYLASAVSGLPSDLKYTLSSWGVPNCINFILHCLLTRFVMNFMGW